MRRILDVRFLHIADTRDALISRRSLVTYAVLQRHVYSYQMEILMRSILVILVVVIVSGCAQNELRDSPQKPIVVSSSDKSDIAQNSSYGFTPENPIVLGDGNPENGPINETLFIETLKGPGGEKISYRRLGSCCVFKTPNGFLGSGLLDKYEVTHEGLDEPIFLYFNMYDQGEPKIPEGLSSTFATSEEAPSQESREKLDLLLATKAVNCTVFFQHKIAMYKNFGRSDEAEMIEKTLPQHLSPVILQLRDGRLEYKRATELFRQENQKFREQIEPCLNEIEGKIDADLASLDEESRSEAEQNLETFRKDKKFEYADQCQNGMPDAPLCNSINDKFVNLLKLQ